jgi:hypothetical protein
MFWEIETMRIASFILTAIIFVAPAPALAQDWINYFDLGERFSVNLPGEPMIEETTIVSQRGGNYPARIYRANDGDSSYMVKVVNYTGSVISDVRGSMAWEAWQYRKAAIESDGEITFDGYAQVDRIEGHQLQITNANTTRTYVALNLLASRLYLLEAIVPADAPPPALFQVSLQMLDENGERASFDIDPDGQRTDLGRETLR